MLFGCAATTQAEVDVNLWARLEAGGYVILLQHASALPAARRSPGLSPENCGENDELSGQGQLEATRLRDNLQRHNVSVGRVLTSHDCSCVQTAGVVFGRAEPWSIIDDAVNDDASRGAEKSSALREAVGRWSSNKNLVLISHRSNFQQAFGAHPDGARLLVIEPLGDDGYRLLGLLSFN
jgi:phosphohistidine phosphatase SixA